MVYRSVTPLGAYGGATDSPWNKGYTQARDQAVAAISALVEPTTGMDSGLVIEAPPVPGGGLDREALRRVVLNAMHGGAACRVMAGWCVHESTADRVVAALAPLLTGGERDG